MTETSSVLANNNLSNKNLPNNNEVKNRELFDYLLLILKGMAMGAADVVPGVSGGTIAFISGIYEELLDSLRRFTPHSLVIFYRQGFRAFWLHVNASFLVALFFGVAVSLLTLSRLISYCLDNYPVLVWSFFFGLVVASIIYIVRQLDAWRWQEWLMLLLGAAIALAISLGESTQLPTDWWMIFLAGSIAICAMILPGISGSFILLLMGIYPVFLNALKTLDVVLLASFFSGCVCGLLAFSHVLSWLLRHYHSITLSLLTGFLVGSLNVIWPWKHTLESRLDRHGDLVPLIQENLLPHQYQLLTGFEAYTFWAFVLAVFGVALVLGLEYLAGNLNRGK